MSGGGGGSSGQVSYPQYLQTFHSVILDQNNTDSVGFSIADALNAAHANSPFTGVTVADPASYLTAVLTTETAFAGEVTSYIPIDNYTAAYAAALGIITLDTTPFATATLDSTSLSTITADTAVQGTANLTTATIDTAPAKDVAPVAIPYTAAVVTPDTIDVDETALEADIATYADQLRADIENSVLPRYKAGMLNVNAITSSAFVIGEALIWAEYDRNVARYAAELRSKIVTSNDGYNVQFKITASTQYNERVLQAQRLTAQESLAVREENRIYSLAFREENRAYKLAGSQQNMQYSLAYTGETKDLSLAFSDQTVRLKLAASEQNARFKLANTDETTKLKLAHSEQNMRFTLQANELDASHKLNRQKNIVMATAEIVRMMQNKVEFKRLQLDYSIKVNAMQITAYNEQIHEQTVIDEADAKWDLELFQYAANLLAAVSGGTSQNQKKTSKAVSALGGALSGAALGASVGGPYAPITAAAGAVIGGLAGYLGGG